MKIILFVTSILEQCKEEAWKDPILQNFLKYTRKVGQKKLLFYMNYIRILPIVVTQLTMKGYFSKTSK